MIDEVPARDAVGLLLPLWSAGAEPADGTSSSPPMTILVTAEAVHEEPPTVERLRAAGLSVLGYVDLAYATRPPTELRGDVARLAQSPIDGIFLDRAPTTPYAIGPVALAVRSARRAGLDHVIVNPGLPADPVYDILGAAMCAFEGTWSQYRRMPDHEFRPGVGHLVHAVPAADRPAVRELMMRRRAGFGFATERAAPGPYGLAVRSGMLASTH